VKYFGLIWKNVWRKKIRTSLTILSVLVAFLLFFLLSAIGKALTGGGASIESASRLVVIHKVSLINPLPISYMTKIAAVTGVDKVSHATWFGGYYQDPKNQFGQFPIEAEEYLAMYPELEIPAEQLQAFLANRTGALLGSSLAKTYGLKVGDRMPIQAVWTRKDGSRSWEFDIEGIMTNTSKGGSDAMLLFHYDYFDEGRAFGQGTVGWYTFTIDDVSRAAEISNIVDMQFANSPNETKTSTEAAFTESFMKQFGNISLIVRLVLSAVFFTILLVAGNTMAQSVRERLSELAVLKTLGFQNGSVMAIVLAESILVMMFGGLIGLGLAAILVQGAAKEMAAFLPGLALTNEALLSGVLIMILAGAIAGIFPAIRAMRLTIVEALARS